MFSTSSEGKSNKLICVIGDVMLDHYIYGTCNRISPEAPVPVVEVTRESYTLGGAGNVLKNILSLGCEADLLCVIGDDDNAINVAKELEGYGISNTAIIKDGTRCTTTKSRVIVTNHQLLRLDHENTFPINADAQAKILTHFETNIDSYDIVLISDYNKGLLTPSLLSEVFKACRAKGVKTIVDPKGLDFSKYRGASIIKPNRKEASLATGINIVDSETLERACEKIKEITDCEYVIITMSEDGIAIYSNEGLSVILTKALAIVDVTGAGDTVLASLGVAIASGNSVKQACDFANHAAAVVINKIGSATVTFAEIEATFKN